MARNSAKKVLSAFALVAVAFGLFGGSLATKAAFEAKADVRSQRDAANENTNTIYVSVPAEPSLSGYTSTKVPIQWKLDPAYFALTGSASDTITFLGSLGGGEGEALPAVDGMENTVLMTDGEEVMWSEPALEWGAMTGSLSSQSDLSSALSNLSASNTALASAIAGKQASLGSGSTGQLLRWSGSAWEAYSLAKSDIALGNVPNVDTSTTANISDSTNKRFITDAERSSLAALTGINTGDQDLSGLVPKTRTINGHDLTANLTLTKYDLGLGNVENVMLSTYSGTSTISHVGTLASGSTGAGFTINFGASTLSGLSTLKASLGMKSEWTGKASVSNGVATFFPTSDDTSNGTAICSSTSSMIVTASAALNTANAAEVPFTSLKAIASDRKSFTVNAVVGQLFAPNGTEVHARVSCE